MILNSTALPRSSKTCPEKLPEPPQRCDVATQTLYSFPPILPLEVQELLKKYQIISDNYDDDVASSSFLNESSHSDRSMMDISVLRRKLFINRPESPECDDFNNESFGAHLNFSPPPRTPELTRNFDDNFANSDSRRSNESFGDMFGELSPIRSCSSPAEFNDISMISDCGKERTPTIRRCKNLKKKGKNLSESFIIMENEFKEEEKENLLKTEPKRFGRFDSGFEADDDSKMSAEYMQF